MLANHRENNKKFILAIHSTNDYFGFGYKYLDSYKIVDNFLIKKLDKDLSKNLITSLSEFLDQKKVKCIERIAISIRPANFNASRQITVCARAISQQINCSLDIYSSFQLMAKRIATKHLSIQDNQPFWIFRKLKRRGYIVGKYKIKDFINESEFLIQEMNSPQLYKKLSIEKNHFEAQYDIKNELQELLFLSSINAKNLIFNHWEKALPIYPIGPIN